jgi:hypothetical protein
MLDRAAERGLRHMQPLRGPAEVQVFRNGNKAAQMTEFHGLQ